MYKVIADRSPFWGPVEVIYKSNWKWKAWFRAKLHCWRYIYGRAKVIKE